MYDIILDIRTFIFLFDNRVSRACEEARAQSRETKQNHAAGEGSNEPIRLRGADRFQPRSVGTPEPRWTSPAAVRSRNIAARPIAKSQNDQSAALAL